VFPNAVGDPVFVDRDGESPLFVPRVGEPGDVEGRDVGPPSFEVHDAGDAVFAAAVAGVPVTQDRSTTLVFAHGEPGELVIECEE
jgi:hypothetical protein